jgi:YesN/AraC family two-component response regulator
MNSFPSAEKKPCHIMHLKAVAEARRLGGSYIYICPAGFIFWTSPFYSGERFAGALLSGGVLGVEKQQAVEKFMQNYGGGMHREEIEKFLSDIPRKNGGEVKALAQMMLICADQISGNGIISKKSIAKVNTVPEMPETEVSAGMALSCQNDSDFYTMDKERMLLASLRRGDNGEAKKILKDLLNILYKTTKGIFSGFQIKAIELAVLLSRSVYNPQDIEDDSIIEINNRYLKKIEESRNFRDISSILTVIVDRMSGKIFSFKGVRHSSALRKAERYIWENYTRKISLKEIARASGLSAPYFSTIFKEEMGENLSSYLNRLRVEKASVMLIETNISISLVATACGFEDQSWFSKIFKSYSGISPGKFRERGGNFT